mmetsp:Transcript_15175/g.57222  ORF Transcript_15175/g.57222 Transcript_15175/m.57222 type:complete len:283 (-) Transcript_15175:713-1561(-)
MWQSTALCRSWQTFTALQRSTARRQQPGRPREPAHKLPSPPTSRLLPARRCPGRRGVPRLHRLASTPRPGLARSACARSSRTDSSRPCCWLRGWGGPTCALRPASSNPPSLRARLTTSHSFIAASRLRFRSKRPPCISPPPSCAWRHVTRTSSSSSGTCSSSARPPPLLPSRHRLTCEQTPRRCSLGTTTFTRTRTWRLRWGGCAWPPGTMARPSSPSRPARLSAAATTSPSTTKASATTSSRTTPKRSGCSKSLWRCCPPTHPRKCGSLAQPQRSRTRPRA